MKIRFFNTYQPVTSFCRDLASYLAEAGLEIEIVISAAEQACREVINLFTERPLSRRQMGELFGAGDSRWLSTKAAVQSGSQ